MRSKSAVPLLFSAVVLGLTAWAFVMIIWIPLYGHGRTQEYLVEQEQPALQADIVKEDAAGGRSWSVADQQALRRLRDGLRQAEYSGAAAKEPRPDQKYRLRIRRPDARVDEYELLLDDRGSDRDLLYVVRRNGGSSVYGSAFKTPELRSALEQVLKNPPPPAK